MSVSRHAIDTVFAQLKTVGEQSYPELVRATGFSRATVKDAISYLKMQGSVTASITKPVIFKAVSMPPMAGQTLIVRETLPPQELNSKIIADIRRDIANGSVADPVLAEVFKRIKEATPDKLNKQLVLFVNLSEVIRELLTTNEIDLGDIDPHSLKGKK